MRRSYLVDARRFGRRVFLRVALAAQSVVRHWRLSSTGAVVPVAVLLYKTVFGGTPPPWLEPAALLTLTLLPPFGVAMFVGLWGEALSTGAPYLRFGWDTPGPTDRRTERLYLRNTGSTTARNVRIRPFSWHKATVTFDGIPEIPPGVDVPLKPYFDVPGGPGLNRLHSLLGRGAYQAKNASEGEIAKEIQDSGKRLHARFIIEYTNDSDHEIRSVTEYEFLRAHNEATHQRTSARRVG